MMLTDHHRALALERRRHRQAVHDRSVLPMLRRVAAVGGGLSRSLRCLQDYGMTRASRGGAWTRHQLYRIAQRHSIRIAPGRFVPGQPAFDTTCGRCGQSLRDTPWCSCLPRPRSLREYHGLPAPRQPRRDTEPKGRLAKWIREKAELAEKKSLAAEKKLSEGPASLHAT